MRISAISATGNYYGNKKSKNPTFNGNTQKMYDVMVDSNHVHVLNLKEWLHYSSTDKYTNTSPVGRTVGYLISKCKQLDINRFFEKQPNVKNYDLYVADPYEIPVSENIRNKHSYVVYDLEPQFPAINMLKDKYTSKDENTHNYFDDLEKFIAYQDRVISSSEKNIENADESTKSQIPIYNYRIEKAKLRQMHAKNLLNILGEAGDDFVQRDIIVNEIKHLKGHLGYLQEHIGNYPHSIEEYKEKYREQAIIVDKLRNGLTDKDIESLINEQLRSKHGLTKERLLDEKTKQLLQEYKELKYRKQELDSIECNYKNNNEFIKKAPTQIVDAENRLENLLKVLEQKFFKIKEYFEKNNLQLI